MRPPHCPHFGTVPDEGVDDAGGAAVVVPDGGVDDAGGGTVVVPDGGGLVDLCQGQPVTS